MAFADLEVIARLNYTQASAASSALTALPLGMSCPYQPSLYIATTDSEVIIVFDCIWLSSASDNLTALFSGMLCQVRPQLVSLC